MPRLNPSLLSRAEQWCDRRVSLVQSLESTACPRWLRDQLGRSGTSCGANLFEADQALSRQDFCKCLGIAIKEMSETRFWIRLVGRRGWVAPDRLTGLEAECIELQKLLNKMIINTRSR